MTKQARLSELKAQDKFAKIIMKEFDAGWREWVKDIYQQNHISNLRMFKILNSIKGSDFITDLISLMGKKNKFALLNLTKKPKGILLKDDRFKTIPEIMINKYPSSSYREGEIFIQINAERWVYFVF